MARLRLYNAGTGELKPTNEGYSAAEMEARRVNPLFRGAASDIAEIGKLQEETIKARKWPLDYARFFLEASASKSRGGGGINVKGGGGGMLGTGAGQMANAMASLARANAQIAAAENATFGGPGPNTRGGMLVDTQDNTTMRGRQTFAGTSAPDAHGLITPPGSILSPSQQATTTDIPSGVDPDTYLRSINAPFSTIGVQPLDGSVPPSPQQITIGADTPPGVVTTAPGFTPYIGPANPDAAGNFPALPPGEPLQYDVSGGPNGTMIPAGTPDPSAVQQNWPMTPTFNATDTTSWLDGAAQTLGLPDASTAVNPDDLSNSADASAMSGM